MPFSQSGGDIAPTYILSDTSQELYHYTSANGLFGIMESETFWASSSLYLNDSAEVTHLESLVREILDHVAESDHRVTARKVFRQLAHASYDFAIDYYRTSLYVLSLTDEPDSLTLWQSYAPTQGYVLRLAPDALIRACDNPSSPKAPTLNARLGRVVYDEATKAAVVQGIADLFVSEFCKIESRIGTGPMGIPIELARVMIRLADFAYLSKHPSYSSEREYRLLISPRDNESQERMRKHRIRNGVFTPYTEIAFGRPNTGNPIKEIRVGPKHNTTLAVEGLRDYLEHRAFSIPVVGSALPLRE